MRRRGKGVNMLTYEMLFSIISCVTCSSGRSNEATRDGQQLACGSVHWWHAVNTNGIYGSMMRVGFLFFFFLG